MAANKEWRDEILNKGFQDRLNEVVLQIGQDTWTRQEVVERLKCGNFRAAQILNAAIAEHFPKVKSASELSRATDVYTLFTIKGVGVATVYVFMCVLESLNKSPLKWLDKDAEKFKKLDTYKRRAQEE